MHEKHGCCLLGTMPQRAHKVLSTADATLVLGWAQPRRDMVLPPDLIFQGKEREIVSSVAVVASLRRKAARERNRKTGLTQAQHEGSPRGPAAPWPHASLERRKTPAQGLGRGAGNGAGDQTLPGEAPVSK